jgi:hypothetical protein
VSVVEITVKQELYALIMPREYIDFRFEEERGTLVNFRQGGSEVYQAATWFSNYGDKRMTSVGDEPIYDFLQGYFGADVVYSWSVYSNISDLHRNLGGLRRRAFDISSLINLWDNMTNRLLSSRRLPFHPDQLLRIFSSFARR